MSHFFIRDFWTITITIRYHSFTRSEFVCLLPCPILFLNFYWSAALSRPSWIFQKHDKEMVSATYTAKGNEILYRFECKYNPNVKENQLFKIFSSSFYIQYCTMTYHVSYFLSVKHWQTEIESIRRIATLL